MWDDGKGVYVVREFFVTFCVQSFFVFLLTPTGHTRKPITIIYGSKRVFPLKAGPFGGLDNKKIMFGVKTPQKIIFGGLNRHFKPNLQNFRIAIFRKVRIRSTGNLKGNFRRRNGLRGWSSITKL